MKSHEVNLFLADFSYLERRLLSSTVVVGAEKVVARWPKRRAIHMGLKRFKLFQNLKMHTVVLWVICLHRDIGNSTYMKVILTKNLTFITIIYHTKILFAKMSESLGNFSVFYYIKVTEIQKITFFHSSRMFANCNFVW